MGGTMMATDYSYLLVEYPEKISQDQLYRICRISKRKATWLLENGYIPCEDTGKKTRRFKIQITDVIAYLTRLEESPETLLTPPGIFSSGIKYKPKRQTAKVINSEKFIAMLKNKWHTFPDALTVNDVTKLTGYCQTTVSEWIKAEKITGVWYYTKYLVPKDSFINYMATEACRIHQKSKKHIELLEQYRNP
jgi:hypothetical protein